MQDRVEQIVREFVARVKPEAGEVAVETPLYADGVGLDSLEAAELSAVLEDEFGTDPFQGETMPETLSDIVSFYATA
ncbi:acyl carrier protein [Nocardioides sp. LHD-245]|uniref:acyl carrier protein n=1 Tax=Nocardioides sp. LHD-245 TaxID=3051387 RepID=UPI0027E18255|nr:acyl carrier protein [Nocardioides sp. LHD-245]